MLLNGEGLHKDLVMVRCLEGSRGDLQPAVMLWLWWTTLTVRRVGGSLC